MFIFDRSPENLYKKDVESALKQERRFAGTPPPFDFGLEYLGASEADYKDPEFFLEKYVDHWFANPHQYLNAGDDVIPDVQEKNGFLEFDSILDPTEKVRFKYDPQPDDSPGRKVALIHIMHWSGRLQPYDTIITFIRNTGLPISTLIHIPAGRWANPTKNITADYDMVSPNIGRTIFEARQNSQDIGALARYLKKHLRYEQVGLFTYSIGGVFAINTSCMHPGVVDFMILHTCADSFAEAVMEGVGTERVAGRIKGNISYNLLEKVWSTISPGAYEQYFKDLPANIRLIQSKYDYTFGVENARRFTEKLRKHKPGAEIETTELSHTTFGYMPDGAGIMWRNLAFIYRHTEMGKYRRAKLFL